jgi:pilus assembly protein CpaE
MREATVLFGVGDPALQDEVLDFLDRRPSVRVVGAASDPESLQRATRERRPDVVVADGTIAARATAFEPALLVVERRESTESLRAALRAGARGFYLWPEEREALARDAEAARREGDLEAGESGTAIAVYPARGGAGATFLATNLAAAFARLGAGVALVDLDLSHADVSAVLTEPDGEGSLGDLAAVADELSAEHVDRIARSHPGGFRLVTAPPGAPHEVGSGLVDAVVGVLRRSFHITVLHVPRSLDPWARAALDAADLVLLVTTLDVPAVRAGRRALDHLDDGPLRERCRLVVNRATRGELVAGDVAEALGVRIAGVIPFDRSVERAQNRGELVIGRSGPASRRVLRLAKSLWQEAA